MSHKIIDIIDLVETTDLQDCQRFFHGRGHVFESLSHINVDWLPPVIVISVYQEEDSRALQTLAEAIMQKFSDCRSVQLQKRYIHKTPFETLIGETINEFVVTEAGLKFHIQLGKAQNTGLFLDMANGRRWVQQHAKNRNILNLFAYTCAFSVAALAGEAKQVVNIDNNKGVLRRGRENHRLNSQDLSKVIFEGVNIFQSYSRLKKYAPYDLLICDPPTFQQGSVKIERDYKKIISRLPQFMQADSDLLLCLNSPDLDADFLKQQVVEFCPACEFVEAIPNPAVFKEAMRGKGLKALHFKYSGVGL